MVRWGRVCNVWMLHILSITMGWCIRVAGCALYQYLLRGWIWISKGWSAAICSKTSSALCFCSSSSNLRKMKQISVSLLILIKFSYSCRFVYISKIKFVFVADCICQVWKNVFARIGSLSGWGGAGWQWFWARICVAPAANGRPVDSVKIQSKAAPSLSDFVANTSNRLKRTLLLALAQVFWHFALYGVACCLF